MKLLVTGGAGYIGSHVCKILKAKGYSPIILDNLSTGLKEFVKWGEFVQGDIGDTKLVKNIFLKHDIKAVLHFAASKSVPESNTNPYKYYKNNVALSNEFLKTIVDCEVKNFIFSSSASIFATTKNGKVEENSKKEPANPYGMSKLMMENILDSYDKAYSLKSTCLRYFNVSGADPECEIGDIINNSPNLLNNIFKAILNKETFTIFGNDYNTPDGTCIRDYIHVWDLAKAHVLALEKQLEKNNSVKINLGNNNGFSVKEIVTAVKKITGIDFPVMIGPKRENDVETMIADYTFARKYLEWNPQYTDIHTQIKHAWNWCKKTNNL